MSLRLSAGVVPLRAGGARGSRPRGTGELAHLLVEVGDAEQLARVVAHAGGEVAGEPDGLVGRGGGPGHPGAQIERLADAPRRGADPRAGGDPGQSRQRLDHAAGRLELGARRRRLGVGCGRVVAVLTHPKIARCIRPAPNPSTAPCNSSSHSSCLVAVCSRSAKSSVLHLSHAIADQLTHRGALRSRLKSGSPSGVIMLLDRLGRERARMRSYSAVPSATRTAAAGGSGGAIDCRRHRDLDHLPGAVGAAGR